VAGPERVRRGEEAQRHDRCRTAIARVAVVRAVWRRRTLRGDRVERLLSSGREPRHVRSAAGGSLRNGVGVPRGLPCHRRPSMGRTRAQGLQLVSGREPSAPVAVRHINRRMPRWRPCGTCQSEPGRGSHAVLPHGALRHADGRQNRGSSRNRGARSAGHGMSARHYETLFHRHDNNPILTAADWPYPAHTVFNAGATRLRDGTTLLLCRVEDRRGHSHLCAARSQNGVDSWIIDGEPTLRPDPENYPEELWGIEDPRITFVDELGKYAIAYTAFTRGGPGVALALTEDFRRFETLRLVMPPHDKDAALLPRRIDGNFALVHRPVTDSGAHVWVSFSPDLRNWGSHKLLLQA